MRVLAVTMRLLVTLTALACAVAVAGCGASSDPGGPSSAPSAASPSSAPSGSPSPSAPTMPEAAKQGTKAGAVAFARHYIDLINYAQATGDIRALKAIEDPRCKSCVNGRKYLHGIYGHGGSISGGVWRVSSLVGAIKNPTTKGYNVDLMVRFGPQLVRRSSSTQHLKGGRLPITIYAARVGRGWEVRAWTRGK